MWEEIIVGNNRGIVSYYRIKVMEDTEEEFEEFEDFEEDRELDFN